MLDNLTIVGFHDALMSGPHEDECLRLTIEHGVDIEALPRLLAALQALSPHDTQRLNVSFNMDNY